MRHKQGQTDRDDDRCRVYLVLSSPRSVCITCRNFILKKTDQTATFSQWCLKMVRCASYTCRTAGTILLNQSVVCSADLGARHPRWKGYQNGNGSFWYFLVPWWYCRVLQSPPQSHTVQCIISPLSSPVTLCNNICVHIPVHILLVWMLFALRSGSFKFHYAMSIMTKQVFCPLLFFSILFYSILYSLSPPQRGTCRGLVVCCRRPCSWTTCGRRWEWLEHLPGEKKRLFCWSLLHPHCADSQIQSARNSAPSLSFSTYSSPSSNYSLQQKHSMQSVCGPSGSQNAVHPVDDNCGSVSVSQEGKCWLCFVPSEMDLICNCH